MAKNSLPISASGQVVTGRGTIAGLIVCAHSSGTIKLIDSPNGVSGRVILDTYTFPSGSSVVPFPKGDNEGVEYYEGVYAIIGGTGVSVEVIYNPAQ